MTLRVRHEPRLSVDHLAVAVERRLAVMVFGPGHGEAIVVIFPDGSLGIVDGCRESGHGGRSDPVREFVAVWLARHPGRRIRFVALTHPHGDHYAGLGRLIEAYDLHIDGLWRTFVVGDRWGAAYIAYAEYHKQNPDETPTADEHQGLARVHAAFQARRERVRILAPGEVLLDERSFRRRLTVHSVAPSANDVDRGLEALHRYLHAQELTELDPNLLSAALVIRWGDAGVLLGGDLVCAQGPFEGWTAAAPRVAPPIQVIKAAHHASEEAQDWGLWARLAPALAIVTPFKYAAPIRGTGGHPPRPELLRRVLPHVTRLAVTSVPQWVHDDVPGPRPTPPTRGRAAFGRNPALVITPNVPDLDGVVCVSLDPDGEITDLLLTGSARLYR